MGVRSPHGEETLPRGGGVGYDVRCSAMVGSVNGNVVKQGEPGVKDLTTEGHQGPEDNLHGGHAGARQDSSTGPCDEGKREKIFDEA